MRLVKWLILLLLLSNHTTFAQPIIDRADFPTDLGQTYYSVRTMDDGYDLSPGLPGSDLVWDFSGVEIDTALNLTHTVVDVAETGFAADFPSANLAIQTQVQGLVYYDFSAISDLDLTHYGQAVTGDPPQVEAFPMATPWLTFPFTFGDTLTTTRTRPYESDTFIGELTEIYEQKFDAWGQITTPAGETFDSCARLRSLVTFTIYPTGVPDSVVFNFVEYRWYQAGHPEPIMILTSREGQTTPNFSVTDRIVFLTTELLSIDVPLERIVDVELSQNYPNPFNPGTSIAFTLPKTMPVRLTIYNSAGQLVKTLIEDSVRSSGNHTIFWDGTNQAGQRVGGGQYLYRLRTPAGDLTRRMILMP